MEKRNTDKFLIDKYDLDNEVNRQADLFMECADNHAEKVKEKDEAKFILERIRAEKDTEIRTNPEQFIEGKVTEKAIENMIVLSERYQKANQKHIDCKYMERLAENEREMCLERRSFIKVLGELMIAGYYGSPEIVERDKLRNKN